MTLNLFVPIGAVQFIVFNQFINHTYSFNLNSKNYGCLHVPINNWVAFKGIDETNFILNIADIEHDPLEVESAELNTFSLF